MSDINIIAEFDGWVLRHNPVVSQKCWFKKGLCHHLDRTHIFKYDSDWNLLMPVIKKIMEMDEPPKESKGWYAYCSIESHLSLVEVDRTYREVLEYINWYNKNK